MTMLMLTPLKRGKYLRAIEAGDKEILQKASGEIGKKEACTRPDKFRCKVQTVLRDLIHASFDHPSMLRNKED